MTRLVSPCRRTTTVYRSFVIRRIVSPVADSREIGLTSAARSHNDRGYRVPQLPHRRIHCFKEGNLQVARRNFLNKILFAYSMWSARPGYQRARARVFRFDPVAHTWNNTYGGILTRLYLRFVPSLRRIVALDAMRRTRYVVPTVFSSQPSLHFRSAAFFARVQLCTRIVSFRGDARFSTLGVCARARSSPIQCENRQSTLAKVEFAKARETLAMK